MKTLILLLHLMTLTAAYSNGQAKYIPETLDSAISFLQKDCPDSLKEMIKNTSADNLTYILFPYLNSSYRTVSDWIFKGDTSRGIKKFLSYNRIYRPFNQQAVILFAFQQTLFGERNAAEHAIRRYQLVERKWDQEDSTRFITDSLRGSYIPANISECIIQIDKMLLDSVKEKIRIAKPNDYFNESHLNFGMFLRNTWQLWMGSRLSKYFNDIGLDHPDTMSGVILAGYYQFLTVKDFNVAEYEKRLIEKYGKYRKLKPKT